MTATRSIPWPRILVEGVAIVVSILLAFGIQAWWEGVQEREEEQDALASILQEFETNSAEREADLGRHQRHLSAAISLIEAILAFAETGTVPEAVD